MMDKQRVYQSIRVMCPVCEKERTVVYPSASLPPDRLCRSCAQRRRMKYLKNTEWRRNTDVVVTAWLCPELSYTQIGKKFKPSISRQRVHQILKREKDRIGEDNGS